jgi:hypothetical protein
MAQDPTPAAGKQSPQPKPAPKPISSIQRRDVRTAVAKNRGW